MPELVTMGETMAVFVPDSAGPLRYAPGFRLRMAGAESNVAVGLCKLGHSAGWISCLGKDELGQYVLNSIRAEGVDTSCVKWDIDHPTGLMIKQLSAGETSVFYYRKNSAASNYGPEDLPFAYLVDAKIIHLSGITPALSESCRAAVERMAEFANEKGEVAPWQSPFSRSGHFMRYFYQRLNAELRMPMEQIHFWTKENAESYSDMIAAEGGADVAYTTLAWSGGIGAIDFESFPAETMEELLQMGSRFVTPAPELIAHESLRGMFGCSGDIGNVPPRVATIGPKDIVAARDRVDVEYLLGCGDGLAYQKFPVKMAFCLEVSPKNPGSLLRTLPGVCYVAEAVAAPCAVKPDHPELADTLKQIREKEGN